jgi:hypothetical protein
LKGIELLAHARALLVLRGPPAAQRTFAERRNILVRQFDSVPQRFIRLQGRRHELRLRDRQPVCLKRGSIKSLSQFKQRRIATRVDRFEDCACAFLDRLVEQMRRLRHSP